jgi:hypothetical protein
VSVGMTAEDASLVLYLTFDDASKPKDLSAKSSPIAGYTEPAEIVEGIKDGAWLFDVSTSVLLDAQTFNDAFQQSTFSVWLREPSDDGIIYEEGGGTNGHAVALIKREIEFCTRNTNQTFIKADYPMMTIGIFSPRCSTEELCGFISMVSC